MILLENTSSSSLRDLNKLLMWQVYRGVFVRELSSSVDGMIQSTINTAKIPVGAD
jgi:hypothetical protein